MSPAASPTATSRSSWSALPRRRRCRRRSWSGWATRRPADQAAVDGMRDVLHSVHMDGIVVIGEGKKDEAPMLYNGEEVGDGSSRRSTSRSTRSRARGCAADGLPNALAVIALSSAARCSTPGPCVYMEKMAGADDIADLLDLDRPLGETVRAGRRAQRRRRRRRDGGGARPPAPRAGHRAIRAAGARVRLIPDGDVSGALMAVLPPLVRRSAVGHRRHAGGRDLGGRGEVYRRPPARSPVAPRRRRAPGAHRRRLRPRPRAHARRPGRAATTASSRPPA